MIAWAAASYLGAHVLAASLLCPEVDIAPATAPYYWDQSSPSLSVTPQPTVAAVQPSPSAQPVPSASPRPTVHVGTVSVKGVASWVRESLGPNYLALPTGRGHRVRICGAAHCVIMVSNDIGPVKRLHRVADIALVKWEYITGLPSSRGLAYVTVEYPGG